MAGLLASPAASTHPLANVTLPVRHNAEHLGVIDDADGREVCCVDMHNFRPDDEVVRLAGWIAAAINAHGVGQSEPEVSAQPESSAQ